MKPFFQAAVLVSANTKESTLETFFRSFEYVVQERAAVLKEGGSLAQLILPISASHLLFHLPICRYNEIYIHHRHRTCRSSARGRIHC